jgi:hypothetical protein
VTVYTDMRNKLSAALCAVVICAWLSTGVVSGQGSTLVVHHNANFREKPSTQSTILDHLEPGDAR